MERRDTVKVKSGKEYDYLFPRAMLTTITKKKGATVSDTVKFIPQVVSDTLFHTKKLAEILEGDSLRETCRNIWQFVYDYIAYQKDEDGKEQIRSPARTWHDRGNNQGVDCDCYTVFISSILSNLKIRHVLRITKYKEDHFQHIYPIVPLDTGGYITIDCVVRKFDYEEPYTEKKDTKMDLEYLNGLGETDSYKNVDAIDLMGMEDDKEAMAQVMGNLGKIKFKDVLKKGLHLTNILNPATATIRAGVLLSAKLNIMKIGERLKWAYMSDADAKKKGIDMGKFAHLKKIKDKLEKIFYGMGGSTANLKKAILKGKGNKNHDVAISGLGYIPDEMDGIDENDSVSTILGTEIYNDELSGIDDGANGLGIVTATAIASATGVVGAIAALIKGVGNIFPKKAKDGSGGSGDGTSTTDSGGGGSDDSGSGTTNVDTSGGSSGKSTDTSNTDGTAGANNQIARKKSDTPATTNDDTSTDDTSGTDDKDSTTKTDSKGKSFWLNNKKWIKPTGFGIAGLLAFLTGLHFYKKNKKEEAPKKQTASEATVSGIPKSRKKKKKKGGHPGIKSKKKKTAVALM